MSVGLRRFALMVALLFSPMVSAKTTVIYERFASSVFHGTVSEKSGGRVVFRVNHVWSGKLGKTVDVSKADVKLGHSYVVRAKTDDNGETTVDEITPRHRFSKYLNETDRKIDIVPARVIAELNARTKKLHEKCESTHFEILWEIQPDGRFMVEVAPNVLTTCVLEHVNWKKRFAKMSDGLPVSAAVKILGEGKPRTTLNVTQYVNSTEEPAALFTPFQTAKKGKVSAVVEMFDDDLQYKESLRHLCKHRGKGSARRYAQKWPNADFSRDLFRCGLYHRDFEWASGHVHKNRAPSIFFVERELVRPFAEQLKSRNAELSSPEKVEARVGFAHFVDDWGNEPVLLEIIADAFAKAGDKRLASLTLWRLSLVDKDGAVWQEKATTLYPKIASDWAAREISSQYETSKNAHEERVKSRALDSLAESVAFHIVGSAEALRPKRDAPSVEVDETNTVLEWTMVIGGLLLVFVLGAWVILKKVNLD